MTNLDKYSDLAELAQLADKEEDRPTLEPGSSATPSRAAELLELRDLRDRGALTATEFEQRKAILLGRQR